MKNEECRSRGMCVGVCCAGDLLCHRFVVFVDMGKIQSSVAERPW